MKLEIILPIITLLLGAFLTYFLQLLQNKKEDKFNQRKTVYLEFLKTLGGAYSYIADLTRVESVINEYYVVLNELYLVASKELLKVLVENNYILTDKNAGFFLKHNSKNPLKDVIKVMRKDLGLKAKDFDLDVVCLHSHEDDRI